MDSQLWLIGGHLVHYQYRSGERIAPDTCESGMRGMVGFLPEHEREKHLGHHQIAAHDPIDLRFGQEKKPFVPVWPG